MADPLFILAPGRTFTSVVAGMIGQHPEMYGFPELYLNNADTVRGWWIRCGRGQDGSILHHGLLRAVAELYFGGQSEATVAAAWDWITARFNWDSGALFHELTDRIAPRVAVEKSPLTVQRFENMERLTRFYPGARYIHLVRHPTPTCASLLKFERAAAFLARSSERYDFSTDPPTLDPQLWWYESHLRIKSFTDGLPPAQWRRYRGEAFLEEPQTHLREVAAWLGLRTDEAAIEEMMHPERSPYAHPGPPSAPYGNDPSFLEAPEFRPFRAKADSLDDALPWRPDGCGYLLEVRDLARVIGYR